ncbi:hypothetical protein D3C72_1833790 [compost metagenome]
MLAHVGEDRCLALALGLVVQRRLVQRCQPVARAEQQRAELLAARVVLAIAGTRILRRILGQPALHARGFHGGGKGLVEGGVVAHVDHLVRQFVEDQPRQLALRQVDEGIEQRVVEIAQRRIGGDAGNVGLEPVAAQAPRILLGIGLGVVAAVADAADDGEAPLAQLH